LTSRLGRARGRTKSHYTLSFTVGGLLSREAAILAPIYTDARDWVVVRDVAVEENLLTTRTRSTGVRLVRETIARLSALADSEVECLTELTGTERSHLMWAAACRRYSLVGEFAEEVLRERFLTLAGRVTYENYDSFYRAKAMWNDELDTISEATYRKLRQVLFKMMVEAELLTTAGTIEPVLLSTRIASFLDARTPSDIRFFPTRLA